VSSCFEAFPASLSELVGGAVTKLRATNGAFLGTFTVGLNPIGMAFDGANIWVANMFSGTVSKL